MPFHICADEILMFMMAVPVIGGFVRLYRAKIHAWFHRAKGSPKSLKPECPHDHKDHS
jgi:hypothetical protein